MWIDTKQNSDDWFNLRLGLITSSNFGTIMANEGKAFGQPALKYARKKALERVTGKRDETDSLKSGYLDRGHELEPEALKRYSKVEICIVSNGGFNKGEGEYSNLGDSPDGIDLIKNGCVEVKSVIPETHFKMLETGKFDSKYDWQIQGHIWLGKYKYCDCISYCPEMPEDKQILIERKVIDLSMITRLVKRLKEFEKVINKYERILLK
jgi:hypothetical protein